MLMVVVFAAALGGFLAWIRWLWRRTVAPVWTSLVALALVGLGAWCVVAMASAFLSSYQVPETLVVPEQERQAAMYDARAYRWGMRFWAAGLMSTGWLLFVTLRWDTDPPDPRADPSELE
jgi:hypothetical protein